VNPEQTGASLRQLADRARKAFPDHPAHLHLADAARAVSDGQFAGAQRHLHAAIASFTPQHLHRLGYSDDISHQAGKKLMGEAHRHLLLVKDVAGAMGSRQPPPAGRSDGTANGPAQPRPRAGQVLTADPQHGIELARRAVGL
jgi:hypothetical protein